MTAPENRFSSVHRSKGLSNVLAKVGGALRNWLRAILIDACVVGALWMLGLSLLHVPLAPLWAILAALAQFIPNFGSMIALIGPTLSILFAGRGLGELGLLLGLYAGIVLIDVLGVQPFLMKKNTRVPVWASIFGPIVLGIVIPFWGVLLAPPLLAVAFAFRHRPRP